MPRQAAPALLKEHIAQHRPLLAGGRSLQLPPAKAHCTLQLPASMPDTPADTTYLVLWGIGAVTASSSEGRASGVEWGKRHRYTACEGMGRRALSSEGQCNSSSPDGSCGSELVIKPRPHARQWVGPALGSGKPGSCSGRHGDGREHPPSREPKLPRLRSIARPPLHVCKPQQAFRAAHRGVQV